jgi:hypothetical protein
MNSVPRNASPDTTQQYTNEVELDEPAAALRQPPRGCHRRREMRRLSRQSAPISSKKVQMEAAGIEPAQRFRRRALN